MCPPHFPQCAACSAAAIDGKHEHLQIARSLVWVAQPQSLNIMRLTYVSKCTRQVTVHLFLQVCADTCMLCHGDCCRCSCAAFRPEYLARAQGGRGRLISFKFLGLPPPACAPLLNIFFPGEEARLYHLFNLLEKRCCLLLFGHSGYVSNLFVAPADGKIPPQAPEEKRSLCPNIYSRACSSLHKDPTCCVVFDSRQTCGCKG